MGLRETILAAGPKLEKVNVPEWGVDVWLKPLSGDERDLFNSLRKSHEEKGTGIFKGVCAPLLILAIRDEKGEPVFKPDDAAALLAKDGAVLDRLSETLIKISGLTQEEKDAAKKD